MISLCLQVLGLLQGALQNQVLMLLPVIRVEVQLMHHFPDDLLGDYIALFICELLLSHMLPREMEDFVALPKAAAVRLLWPAARGVLDPAVG